MRAIKINLKKRSYSILVGNNTLGEVGKHLKKLSLGDTAYIITNAKVKRRYGKIISASLKRYGILSRFKTVADSEKSKSLNTASAVINDLTRHNANSRVFVIALGGGVIGDLAGFVASIYKRGVAYIQVPTTLLAQVDSSIGGKTAVDLEQGKNLVGTFYQPRLVFCDISTLKSLPERQLKSGLAEIIKCAVIKDPRLFDYLKKHSREILALKPKQLEHALLAAVAVKAKIVQADEMEKKGIRTILNFGHTIGHAIEAAGKYRSYAHGEAVALGMLVATDLSRRLGLINNKIQNDIKNLIRAASLPLRAKGIRLQDIIARHYLDKKFSGSRNRFVLIRGIGKTRIVQNIPLALIKKSIQETIL